MWNHRITSLASDGHSKLGLFLSLLKCNTNQSHFSSFQHPWVFLREHLLSAEGSDTPRLTGAVLLLPEPEGLCWRPRDKAPLGTSMKGVRMTPDEP